MNKALKIGLIVTGSLAVLSLGIWLITKPKKPKRDKDDDDGTSGTAGTSAGTGSSKPEDDAVNWNPDPLAKEISKNMEGWNLKTYPETAKKVLLLSDAKLKKLYTHYNKKYAKSYPTLTQLYENEWSDWNSLYGKVVDRLVKLGLN